MARGATAPLVGLVSKEDAPPEVRAVYDQAEPVYGRLLHTWQALAQRPEIFTAYLPYLRSIIGPGELEQRIKELVEVRTVVLNHCLYSTSHRVRSARAAAVPDEDIIAVARGELDGFDARERLALELAEALTVAPASVRYADAPQLVARGGARPPARGVLRAGDRGARGHHRAVERAGALPSRDGLRARHGRSAG